MLGKLGGAAQVALGTLAGNLMSGAIQKVGELARAIGDTLLNEAPALEQVSRSFENLAASAGASADEVLASMREAANGMISDADLMTSYNEAMLLVGDSMADQFPALLEIASASAAATGQSVGFMLDSLVKGIGRASPMILDNLGLTIDMADAYALYADNLGISTEEMTKAQQQTAIMNAVVAQGGDFIERLGENTGGAAASIAQMRTRMENLKNGIALALLPALGALLGPLGELADQYGPAITAWAEQAGIWLSENLPSALAKLQEVWATVWPQIQAAVEVVWPILQVIFQQVADWLQNDGPSALAGLQAAWDEVWGFIQEIMVDFVVWFAENLPLIQEAGQVLVDFWQNHIVPALDNIWNIIKAIVQVAIDIIQGIITTVMQIIVGDWAGAWQTIQDTAAGIWDALKIIAGEFIEGVLNAIGTNLEEFQDVWRGNWESLQKIVGQVWDNITEALGGAINDIVEKINGLIDKIKSVWENTDWGALGRGIIDGIVGAISNGIGAIADAARRAARAALDAAKDLLGIHSPSTAFAALGENVVMSFADRMRELADVPAQAAGHMVQKTTNAAMDSSDRSVTIYGGVHQYGSRSGGLLAELQEMMV